ncbi:hypothetical protein Taro_043839 [Colocasia esculenta]|uniref:Uncharacterized protein n=1 Tax=Colocasia esculenta TaxID=4460 RepID=A0A843WWR9_COLES|nr:hypothetical protein [Colocasia esculenta]
MDNVDNGGTDAEDNIATKDDADTHIHPSDVPIVTIPQLSVEFESGNHGSDWSIDPPRREGKKRKLEKGKTETPKSKQISIAPNTPLCRVLSPFPQTLVPVAISQSAASAPIDAAIQCGTKPAQVVAILTSPLPGHMGTKPSISPVPEHNHKLAPPNMCHLLRSQRFLPTVVERDEELKKDFKASLGTPTLVFQSEILKQAAVVYTPTLFLLFQSEMEKVWDSDMHISTKAAEAEETYVFALTEVDRLLLQVEDKLKSFSLCNHNLHGCSEIDDMDASNDNRTSIDYDNESPLTSKGIRRKKLATCVSSKKKKGAFAKAVTKGKAQKEMTKPSEISPYSQPIMVQTNNIMSTPFNHQESHETSVLGARPMDRCTNQPFTIIQVGLSCVLAEIFSCHVNDAFCYIMLLQPSPHEMYQPITSADAYAHAINYQNTNVPNGQGCVGMGQALGQGPVTCNKWI